jgi:hypothetical protein
VKCALKSDSPAGIKSATDRLNATWQEVAQRMYQEAASDGAGAGAHESAPQGGAGGGEAASGESAGPGGAVDAEYEVIDGDGNTKK